MPSQISKALKRYNYLSTEINAVYHELSLRLGLTDSSMTVLYTICDNGGSCLLQDICHSSGISKQTLNSALRKLETEGIICLRSAGAKNKRVFLTESGQKLAEETAGKIIATEEEVFASWDKNEVEKYLELTERYLLDLREKSKKIRKENDKR